MESCFSKESHKIMDWISVEERFPENEKVLAIYVSKPGVLYNMRHDGWFRDTIYTCRINEGKFIIESHGPYLPATHWMPLPYPPNVECKTALHEEK